MKELWTSLASLMGVFAFCQTLVHAVFPPELRFGILKISNRIFNWLSSYYYFDITEIDGVNTNELYNAVQLYLSSSASITGSRVSLTRALNSSGFTYGLANNDSLVDSFNGITAYWEHHVIQRQSQTFSWRPLPDEKRGFTLKIKKKDKAYILKNYLDYVMEMANDIRRKNQERLLYTNSRGGSLDSRGYPWESVPFKHPSTFDTLAMDPSKKTELMEDLRDFADGQAFYQTTGRAWKRGYLLYGPPGTGKSSMIAAMANYLGYDIYDLELTEVNTNSELRKLLMKTTSKSIIVIEDIDCSVNFSNRKKPNGKKQFEAVHPEMRNAGGGGEDGGNTITLSGLLNFTDGLWSCCGSERIFVFTTNHIEKLDPALLRSGRMDMHISMSYCTFEALKILLKNYLGLSEGDVEKNVLNELEEVVDEAKMTPADISEVLIKNRRNKEKAVLELLDSFKVKKAKKNRVIDVEEEEEQEKRALESPKQGCEESVENCIKGNEVLEEDLVIN
ncbi:Aaa-atpase [Thalictrum thalictroides]|uniref:Aaa-atpase n=1 Tax=Thalictrum thalictroides TaxID=46969 RepID=A0A7J6WYL9_THATH|nr:Aaa-atpase [Thalictrum thalictroides]